MSDTVITVEKLSKCYFIGHQSKERETRTTFRDMIGREARIFAQKTVDLVRGRQVIQGDVVEEFWALKNVSFEVRKGEIIGIIGRNGAGKSTLLKILSRITAPTEGRVLLRGRVASLLEVGTGFHPELSGRENIFLNGAVLGMTRGEIRRKFDEIVAFAEVEKFIDTPVKRYSSGMHVRLAFAVAAHLEPEILVVDEVLAVGDAEFQKKCIGKMDEVSRRKGRTVLFVSHHMGILAGLCPLALWLEQGSIRQQGPARNIIGEYLAREAPHRGRFLSLDELPRQYVESEDRLRLQGVEWLCDLPLKHGEPLRARIHLKTRKPLADISLTVGFSHLDGIRLLSYDSDLQGGFRPSKPRPGDYSVDVEVGSLPLAPGIYNLDLLCRSGGTHSLDYIRAAVKLEVVAGPTTPGFLFHSAGGVRDTAKWVWADHGSQNSRQSRVSM
jgi:lipopolysaccharide transport system ATP-binding protein